jgi:hypothetical protein
MTTSGEWSLAASAKSADGLSMGDDTEATGGKTVVAVLESLCGNLLKQQPAT